MQENELKKKVKELEKIAIFKELCPKQKYQISDDCHVCKIAIKKSMSSGLGLKDIPIW